MSERTCLLHVGTHKTGTTSLQLFFDANKPALRSAGVYLPDAGRYGALPGNHCIAWDMLAEGRSAHFDTLIADLGATECRTALVGSEDFSLLHARPDALQTMADGLRSAGYRPVVVVYLRPQAAFAESMYVERVKHNYIRALGSYVQTILTTGSYVPDGTAIHLMFDYTRLLDPFVRAFGRENVIVRPYDTRNGVEHIFRDFLSVFAAVDAQFTNVPLSLQVHAPRANDSLKFVELLFTAYKNLHDGKVESPETFGERLVAMVREIAPNFPDELFLSRYALLSRAETLTFLQRFAADNEAIEREYGVRVPFRSEADIAPSEDPIWERARVEREVYDRLLERWQAGQ